MNKITFFIVIILLASVSWEVTAQAIGFTYQAVAMDQSKSERFGKDSQGEVLANKNIAVRFMISEGSEGSTVYEEGHETLTDSFGMFRLTVGRGVSNQTPRDLSALNWGILPYFLHVELDMGNGFEYMGSEELMGSPYALNTVGQSLEIKDRTISLSQGGGSVTLPIEQFENLANIPTGLLDGDDNTQLTETQVDNYAANNGYLTSFTEIDGDPINEIQTLSISGQEIFLTNGGSVVISEIDGNPTNEIQTLSISGQKISLTNGGSVTLSPHFDGKFTSLTDVPADISDGDDNTQLTETQVDDYASDNGYLTSFTEVDGSVTNEIQDLSLTGDKLVITNNAGATEVDLSPYKSNAVFSTTSGVTSNVGGNLATDDFVFGSAEMTPTAASSFSRMLFDKSKSAFRAGRDKDGVWNDAQTGEFTMAVGDSAVASGDYSVAFGFKPVAAGIGALAFGRNAKSSGVGSLALGFEANASSNYSIALGSRASATANYAVAIGPRTSALAQYAVAIGFETRAESTYEMSLGAYNTVYTPGSSSDRMFVVGNGTSTIARADALVIQKNGNVFIGDDFETGTSGSRITGGARVLYLNSGSSPSALTGTDQTAIWNQNGEIKVKDNNDNETVISPHNFSLIPKGKSEDMAWTFYSQRDEKTINVDMAKVVRLVEKMSGEPLIYIHDQNTNEVKTAVIAEEKTLAFLQNKIENQQQELELLRDRLNQLEQLINK